MREKTETYITAANLTNFMGEKWHVKIINTVIAYFASSKDRMSYRFNITRGWVNERMKKNWVNYPFITHLKLNNLMALFMQL